MKLFKYQRSNLVLGLIVFAVAVLVALLSWLFG